METVYTFKAGSHLRGDPQAVGERLDAIRARSSGLTAESVVDDARKKSSPLHEHFEWDDADAAEKYRLEQARYLIRSVSIVFVEPEGGQGELVEQAAKAVTVRAFMPVNRSSDGERIYESTATALSDADYRKQVLQQAHFELAALSRKYRELSELAEVVIAIDRVGELLTQPATLQR